MPGNTPLRREWTVIGLVVALLGIPLVMAVYTMLDVPRTAGSVLARELIVFAMAGILLWLIRSREGLGWNSVGLQRPAPANTALWVVLTFFGVGIAFALAMGVARLVGWQLGGDDTPQQQALPLWVILVVVVRAGFVEELFYRGYAIERLESLTGSRVLALSVPLLLFALFHYKQGPAGIVVALFMGAVLTGVYVYKRNLWIPITAHFLVDFVPNYLLPLFGSES